MCGIIGYCGKTGRAASIIFDGLKKMEYRGYDSSGIATIDKGKIIIRKGVGLLEDVNREHHLDSLPGHVGIGHTRWATHGGVTEINTHPHHDCKDEIAVIHNGIIDNYQALRHSLIKRGHNFISETDTEVIPHKLEAEMAKGRSLVEAVLATAPQLEGSYAFLAICIREPGKIVGTRRGSPLVVGTAPGKAFAASDSLALAGKVDRLYMLGENEAVEMTPEGLTFYDQAGRQIEKKTRQTRHAVE